MKLCTAGRLFGLAVWLLSSALLANACEGRQAKNEQSLLKSEDLWVKALEARDAKTLGCILADEFVDSAVYGELRTRQDAIKILQHREPLLQRLEDLRPQVLGDIGIVHGVNRLSTSAGKEVARVRFTDVFVYRQGRWQAISAQETIIRELGPSTNEKRTH